MNTWNDVRNELADLAERLGKAGKDVDFLVRSSKSVMDAKRALAGLRAWQAQYPDEWPTAMQLRDAVKRQHDARYWINVRMPEWRRLQERFGPSPVPTVAPQRPIVERIGSAVDGWFVKEDMLLRAGVNLSGLLPYEGFEAAIVEPSRYQ